MFFSNFPPCVHSFIQMCQVKMSSFEKAEQRPTRSLLWFLCTAIEWCRARCPLSSGHWLYDLVSCSSAMRIQITVTDLSLNSWALFGYSDTQSVSNQTMRLLFELIWVNSTDTNNKRHFETWTGGFSRPCVFADWSCSNKIYSFSSLYDWKLFYHFSKSCTEVKISNDWKSWSYFPHWLHLKGMIQNSFRKRVVKLARDLKKMFSSKQSEKKYKNEFPK